MAYLTNPWPSPGDLGSQYTAKTSAVIDEIDESLSGLNSTKVSVAGLQDAVADAIAQDNTVALAAAAAVDDEIIGRDLLEAAPIVEEDVIFSVVDDDGRRTWIEVAADGGLTSQSVEKIGERIAVPVEMNSGITELSFAVVDDDGRRTWIEADAAGAPTPEAIAALGGPITSNLNLPTADWAHWGDSLTAAGSSGDWVLALSQVTGRAHYDGGYGGQGVASIAARQGGVPARIALSGDAIPSTTDPVAATVTPSPLNNNGSRLGSISGIAGTLARDGSGNHTFARSVAGDAVTVYPGARFVPAAGESNRGRTVTIWAGRNDFKYLAPALIVQQIQQMIAYLTPLQPRVMVFAIPPSSADSGGDTTLRNAANAALLAAFPQEYLDIVAWLQSSAAATAAGTSFDSDDLSDIAAGLIPRRFTSDGLHYNSVGGTAIAYRVAHEARVRGWL